MWHLSFFYLQNGEQKQQFSTQQTAINRKLTGENPLSCFQLYNRFLFIENTKSGPMDCQQMLINKTSCTHHQKQKLQSKLTKKQPSKNIAEVPNMGCLTLWLSIIFINVYFFSKIATSVIKAPFCQCQCQFLGKVTSFLDNGAFYRRLWNQIHFNVILSSAGQLKKIDVDRSHWNRKCKIKQKNHNKKHTKQTIKTRNTMINKLATQLGTQNQPENHTWQNQTN